VPSLFASSPLVDSGEGTGKALGINDDSLFAVFGVVIGTVFFLFAQWQEQQDDDEDFFDTCAAPRGPTHRSRFRPCDPHVCSVLARTDLCVCDARARMAGTTPAASSAPTAATAICRPAPTRTASSATSPRSLARAKHLALTIMGGEA